MFTSVLCLIPCVCVLVCIECVFVIANICVSVCVHVYEIERERGIDGRTDRWERVSLCRVSLFLCSVCWLHDCPYSSYTSPILPVQRGLHDCHSLLSPPPSPHTPPHTTHPHTQTSLSLPELCWLHDCLACVCAAFSCVDVPEAPWLGVPRTAPSISGNPCTDTEPSGLCVCAAPSCVDVPEAPWLGVPRTAPSISGNPCTDSALQTLSSTAAPGPMTGLSIWTALTVGQTLECQALGQLLQNPQPRRNSRQNGYGDSGRFLIVVGWVVAVWYDVLSATYLWFGCLVALLWLG